MLYQSVRLAHVYLSAESQHAVLNLAYVTTGVYVWEAIQSALHDVWITYMFATRLCLLLGSLPRQDSTRSVNRRTSTASTVGSFESSASSPQPPTYSNNVMPIWGSPLFNSLSQLNYLLLRLSTCLSLVVLLVFLSSRTSDLTSNVYNGLYAVSLLSGSAECALRDLGDEEALCDTSRPIRLISLLAPLVSFAVSNSFLFLLALSIWSMHRRSISPQCSARYSGTEQEEGQILYCHVELELRRCGRGKVLAPICLLLHAAQFALIVLIGVFASDIEPPGDKAVRNRDLVLGTFAYFSLLDLSALALIVVGIMRWRHSKPNSMVGDDDVDHREERVAFGHQDSTVKCAEASASGHGRNSSTSLSEMSFARQNESFNFGNAQTNDNIPFLSSEEPRWTEVTWDDDAAVGNRTPHGSRRDYDRTLVSEENRRDVESSAGRRVWMWEPGSEGAADGRSHDVDNYGMAGESTGVWAHVYTEGRRQGLLWVMIVVLTKFAVFVCVLVDSMRTHDELVANLDFQYLCFVTPALAIITIASVRLFLHITQVSPLGDGFIPSTPSPPFSPSNSTIEFVTSSTRHDHPPRRLSMTSRSTKRGRTGLLPSYVDRSQYKRRVRREVDTAASGAVRTIGGSILLPPPALVSEPRRWRRNNR